MEVALSSDSPFESLAALATALKTEVMSQRDMTDLFDEYRAKHHGDKDETIYDAILDTMDLIVGWCNPNQRVFETDIEP